MIERRASMEKLTAKAFLYPLSMEKRWTCIFAFGSIFLVFFVFFTSFITGAIPSLQYIFSVFPGKTAGEVQSAPPPPVGSSVPRLGYLISGTFGDLDSLWRTLRAVYHPRNVYVVHLDGAAPAREQSELAARVRDDPIFATVGNVHVTDKPNVVTYRGPTMVANTLHACAILLKNWKDWDWFINLSAKDYPLVTQDDILQVFSSLPRNMSFLEHTSQLGWKENQRARPLILDPGLYMSNKSDLSWIAERRDLPTGFKLFTGSAWVVMSRHFVEYCIWGWENLPRLALMYYSNFVSSPEGYFHTVICNAPEFVRTVANHDLHYISWDVPPKQHPRSLGVADFPKMAQSNALFARKFNRDNPVLDKIDAELLGRKKGSFPHGGWCTGSPPCSKVGDTTRLQPGLGAQRVALLIDKIVWSKAFSQNQCR